MIYSGFVKVFFLVSLLLWFICPEESIPYSLVKGTNFSWDSLVSSQREASNDLMSF
jgi:hypothetical protein